MPHQAKRKHQQNMNTASDVIINGVILK